MTEINYEKYHLNRKELLEKVASKMSEKRFQHVLGVEETAIALAKHYQVDVTKASLAALCHDYAKELPDADFKEIIKNEDLDEDLLKWGNNIWHGFLGPYFIKSDLKIFDEEILNAVITHTTGDKKMSPLGKILYVADFIEPHRDFPGVEKARKLAFENLDEAVAYETQHTLSFLVEKGVKIHPMTLVTYNYYVAKLK